MEFLFWKKYPQPSGQQFLPRVDSQNGNDPLSRKVENSESGLVDVAQFVLHERRNDGKLPLCLLLCRTYSNHRSSTWFSFIFSKKIASNSFESADICQILRIKCIVTDSSLFFSFTWVTPSTHSSAPALDVVHANFYFFIALCFGPFRLSPPCRSSTFVAPSSPHLDDISGTHRICYNNHKPYVRIWRYSTQ